MHKLALPIVLIALWLSSAENLYAQTAPRDDSGLTQILLTAIDSNGNIRKLKKDEISLREDGVPQVILDFRIQINPRTSVAIMIDTSLSQKRILPLSKSTAGIFVKGFVRPGRDLASIISFADSPVIRQSATDNVDLLRAAIEKADALSAFVLDARKPQANPKKQVGSTALIDSITFACNNAFVNAPEGARKAIVIFTDGDDSSSSAKTQDAIASAVKKDVAIYAIGLPTLEQGSLSLREDQPKLRRLAQETGGRAYFPAHNEELQSILSQIELNLRAQYIVAFRSSAITENRKRHLSFELLGPGKENAQLAYRRTY